MELSDIPLLVTGHVLVFTGAGISAASGIQTFRGDGGLYEGLNPYDLATLDAFQRHPVTVWNWYLMRIHQGMSAQPNPGHIALAHLEKRAASVTIVTSNVDPLHERAGSTRVYKLHGDILKVRCVDCGRTVPICEGFGGSLPNTIDTDALPRCPCRGPFRPNVVWFGEYPNQDAFQAAVEGLEQADIVLEVGTSGGVSYGFTEEAVRQGLPVVRINPEPRRDFGVFNIAEPAEVALPRWLGA